MTIKVAIRGFVDGKQTFEDLIDVSEAELDRLVQQLAEKHGKAMAAHELTMIEFEFLDDPAPDRFFRFGTDPRGMTLPMLMSDPREAELMRPYKYVLFGQTPIVENDPLKWAEWFETADRQVSRDEMGATVVSTIFMGLDHNLGAGPPMLFETMVFTDGDPDPRYNRRRCATWLEAEAQHRSMVSAVKGNQQCPS